MSVAELDNLVTRIEAGETVTADEARKARVAVQVHMAGLLLDHARDAGQVGRARWALDAFFGGDNGEPWQGPVAQLVGHAVELLKYRIEHDPDFHWVPGANADGPDTRKPRTQ